MMRELLTVNPRAAKKKHKAKRKTHAATNPRPKHKKKRKHKAHSNPRFLPSGMGGVMGQLTPALLGGLGALGMDIALANIPFPATIKAKLATQGPLRLAARAALAIGIGFAAGKVTSKANAAKVVAGGLAVVAYDAIKGVVKQQFPTLALGDWESGDLSAYAQLNAAPDELGAYANQYPSLSRIDDLGAFEQVQGLTAFETPPIDSF